MTILYEESIASHNWMEDEKKSKLYSRLHVLFVFFAIASVLLGVVAVISLIMRETQLLDYIFDIGLVLVSALFIFLSYWTSKMQMKYSSNYDYHLEDDYFSIYHIYNVVKRKLIYEINRDDIFQIGNADSEAYDELVKQGIKVRRVTPNRQPDNNKMFKYILFNNGQTKEIIILECTKALINNLLLVTTPKVLEPKYR